MAEPFYRANVLVCGGTGCTASRSTETFTALTEEIARRGLQDEVRLIHTGCRGFCAMGPVMIVYPEGIFYCQVMPEHIPHLVEETLVKGRVVPELTYKAPADQAALPYYKDIPFYGKQVRITLRNCGLIDPENIEEYIARDGYQALSKALTEMTPAQVIAEMKASGLRGRGGAGFPTGLKWELTARAQGDQKYVVCNADEGDPGAFMDRSILEGDPHSVIEGMMICAYAVGATEGYIYCRAEYPLAIKRLKVAIAKCEEYGLMGDHIFDSDFSFHLHIKEGAGAFVCGEETALLASIEGRRGEPRPRPPFPAVKGLWNKPTNLNNVKSYANSPQIILNGADWYRSIGTEKSPGTAIFALTGKVNNTGLVEVPMGITMGEIVFDIGGGILGGKEFKAVQTGGPLGGCLPAEHLNVPIDFDSLKEVGAVMGSGGMIVVDEDTCMVELSNFFLTFATAESCGKCVPCRVGGKRLLEVLTRVAEGQGRMEDIDAIKEIARGMDQNSLCALGQLTPGPVMSTIRYFLNEYIEHIEDKKCRAGACAALVEARCLNACPAGVDVPTYIALTAQGKTAEALAVHRERNPFALACGRFCPAFCESKCRRGDIDEPIAVRAIKRYMADIEMKHPWTPAKLGTPKAEKVAVVGAGPAGLTAALRLAQMGYPVTVFEKLPVSGGMMAVGIPEYRMPRDVLKEEIANIERAGVEIRYNQALGKDFTVDSLFQDGYKSVILAIGAHKSRKLGVEGEDKQGVYHGVDFLRDVALGKDPGVEGKMVAVVGGGNVAIDAARTAWRLGADMVHLVYRRTRADMPAYLAEVKACEDEGIIYHFLTNPVKVLGDGHVTGIVCQNQELGTWDRSGRRRPVPVSGSEFTLDVDILIPAIGQETDLSWLDGNPSARLSDGQADGSRAGGIEANRDTSLKTNKAMATTRPGVFAVGDAAIGPATVIEAVAGGNKVAVAVDHYLRTGAYVKPVYDPSYRFPEQQFDLETYADACRPEMPELPVTERRACYAEVEVGLDRHAVEEECKRCLRCDLEWLQTHHEPAPVAEMIPVEMTTA